MRHKRKIAAALLVCFFVSNVAYAWVQFLAPIGTGVMWLGRLAASNVTMARAVEWSIYGHGAVLGFLAWKNSGDAAQTTTPINARLVVQPETSAKRDNPDPNKWDNATTTRDPTPKASYSMTTGMQTMPSTYPAVVQAMGYPASASGEFCSGSGCGGAGSTYRRQVYVKNLASCTNTSTSAPGSPWSASSSWCGSVSGQTATGVYAVWDVSTLLSCPTGYTLSSGNCVLNDATQVMKPSGKVPCEVMRNADGTWDIDAKNPECAALGTALTQSGRTTSYTRGAGDYDSVTTNADGSLTISTRGPGGNRDIQTGPYSSSQGGYPITSVTDSPGTGTSTGGTGSGGQTCGGSGQPACAVTVDDSGFQGKDAIVNAKADAAIAKLDERVTQVQGVNDGSTFGVDASWVPSLKPGPVVACSDIQWQPGISHGPLAGLTGSVSVNWCDKADVIREYLAWLFGVATVFAIALLFFSSNKSGGGK